MEASRPLRVVVDVDADLVDQPAGQHLTWLLVTLLVRSTRTAIETIAVRAVDAPLLAGVDPAEPDGGPSYLASLKAAAQAFGPESGAGRRRLQPRRRGPDPAGRRDPPR